MKKIVLLLAAIIALTPLAAFASSDSQGANLTVEIPQLMVLNWKISESGQTVDLTGANAITVSDLVAGYLESIAGGTLEVTSNQTWKLTVAADADYFSGGSGVKPLSDLFIDIDKAETYSTQLNGTLPVNMIGLQAPQQIGEHPLKYKLVLNPQDTAGIYSTNLTYTLMADGL